MQINWIITNATVFLSFLHIPVYWDLLCNFYTTFILLYLQQANPNILWNNHAY